jgi:hypothetical protein
MDVSISVGLPKGVIMSKQLKDLLWKFGVWDDLTDQQHIELQRFIDQYAYEYAERVIGEDESEVNEEQAYYEFDSVDHCAIDRNFLRSQQHELNRELSPHRATKDGEAV